jgi:alkanesulfonate monooxygenase SsuD/methylene tetrahydromethanopterin reductase-like flavin-dependent oxidoreductase (luciferase family)
VAQADQMSGGRIELGLGAGWFEAEHTAYGIPFPPARERFELLTEQLAVVTGLWRTLPGDRFDFDGEHYQLRDCPALPKPAQQPHPPVILGGIGPRRGPALAAEYAAEYNVAFHPIDVAARQFDRVDRACTEFGRDPATMLRSVALTVAVGRDDSEVSRRALAIGRDVEELRVSGLAGTPAEVLDRIGDWHLHEPVVGADGVHRLRDQGRVLERTHQGERRRELLGEHGLALELDIGAVGRRARDRVEEHLRVEPEVAGQLDGLRGTGHYREHPRVDGQLQPMPVPGLLAHPHRARPDRVEHR